MSPRAGRGREQLLDAGAAIVASDGAEGLTMEGVATQAGVSKALPYQHFEDAEDLLVALAIREADVVASRIGASFPPGTPLDVGIRSSLSAYFDVVEERGSLLGAVFQYRFSPAREQEVDRTWAVMAEFFASRFASAVGLPMRVSRAAGYTFLAAVVGGQRTWISGLITRRQAEDLLVHMICDGLRGLADQPSRTRRSPTKTAVATSANHDRRARPPVRHP